MTSISAADAARDFEELLDRVHRHGESFEITRDGQILAHIAPTQQTPSKKFTVGAFREALASIPKLDPEDSLQFEKDLAEIRASAKLPPSPWE